MTKKIKYTHMHSHICMYASSCTHMQKEMMPLLCIRSKRRSNNIPFLLASTDKKSNIMVYYFQDSIK